MAREADWDEIRRTHAAADEAQTKVRGMYSRLAEGLLTLEEVHAAIEDRRAKEAAFMEAPAPIVRTGKPR